jgi:N6-L-threonylcarbamoyladenine synthase
LKTAVLNYLNRSRQRGEIINAADVAASFQEAVVEVLVERTLAAAARCRVDRVAVCGGVAANSALRSLFQAQSAGTGIEVLYPPPVLCTDNGAMIASVGYYRLQAGHTAPLDLNAVPNLPLENWG